MTFDVFPPVVCALKQVNFFSSWPNQRKVSHRLEAIGTAGVRGPPYPVSWAQHVEGRTNLCPFAALWYPASQKVTIYCSANRGSVVGWPKTRIELMAFWWLAAPLPLDHCACLKKESKKDPKIFCTITYQSHVLYEWTILMPDFSYKFQHSGAVRCVWTTLCNLISVWTLQRRRYDREISSVKAKNNSNL